MCPTFRFSFNIWKDSITRNISSNIGVCIGKGDMFFSKLKKAELREAAE